MNAGRLLLALILIALGVVFLLGQFGWLEWDFAFSLWRLWPVVLILIGIQLVLGHRRPLLALLLMVVVLAGGIAVVWAGWDQDDGLLASATVIPIDGLPTAGVSTASLTLEAGASNLTIEGGARGQMVDAEWSTRRQPEIVQKVADGRYELTLRQAGGLRFPIPSSHESSLRLALAPRIPWDLALEVGATSTRIDLTDVTLSRMTVDAGASSVHLILGREVVDGATVEVQGGVGSYRIEIPRSLNVELLVDAGLSSKDIAPEFEAQPGDRYVYRGGGETVNVTVKSGLSSVTVSLY